MGEGDFCWVGRQPFFKIIWFCIREGCLKMDELLSQLFLFLAHNFMQMQVLNGSLLRHSCLTELVALCHEYLSIKTSWFVHDNIWERTREAQFINWWWCWWFLNNDHLFVSQLPKLFARIYKSFFKSPPPFFLTSENSLACVFAFWVWKRTTWTILPAPLLSVKHLFYAENIKFWKVPVLCGNTKLFVGKHCMNHITSTSFHC